MLTEIASQLIEVQEKIESINSNMDELAREVAERGLAEIVENDSDSEDLLRFERALLFIASDIRKLSEIYKYTKEDDTTETAVPESYPVDLYGMVRAYRVFAVWQDKRFAIYDVYAETSSEAVYLFSRDESVSTFDDLPPTLIEPIYPRGYCPEPNLDEWSEDRIRKMIESVSGEAS